MAAEDEVVWMVRGVSLCVRAMCELGVADALDEARSLAELAARDVVGPGDACSTVALSAAGVVGQLDSKGLQHALAHRS
jgi:hypothetical protein